MRVTGKRGAAVGQKDKAEKILESYNDVFADIVNVLLFRGKRVVSESDLEDQTPMGYYKASGEIHEQTRDIAKRWMNGRIRIASYGIENQTQSDRNMPVRVMSYDAADLQAQLLADEHAKLYPIVTLVLYYGYKAKWSGPKRLRDCLTIPSVIRPYVYDYGMHLFEVAYLTREQVDLFQSDFRIVADYFVQKRENKDYTPSRQQIKHVREILQLLRVMEQDDRFEDIYNKSAVASRAERGEIRNMCDVLDKAYEEGARREREKMKGTLDLAIEEGARRERERMRGTLDQAIKDSVYHERLAAARGMRDIGMTLEQIATVLRTEVPDVTELLR